MGREEGGGVQGGDGTVVEQAGGRREDVLADMLKWFASNPGAKSSCLPMLLSAFSHLSVFHL